MNLMMHRLKLRWRNVSWTGVITVFFFLGVSGVYAECVGNPQCPKIKIEDFPLQAPLDWICGNVANEWNAHPEFSQRYADIYSWQIFIALLRHVKQTDNRCETPSNKFPGEDVLISPHESSSPNGEFACVMTWGGRPELFERQGGQGNVPRFDTNADMTGASLFDKNGKQVYYEILVNSVVAQKIRAEHLNTPAGQKAQDHGLQFRSGQCKPRGDDARGAIEVKLAWKELHPDKDDSKKFLKRTLKLDDGHSITAGLVGIHIAHLTRDHQSWIWSTFEHVDNDTIFDGSSTCPEEICPVNTPPLCPPGIAPQPLCPGGGSLQPTEIRTVVLKRTDPHIPGAPISEETKELNNAVHSLLEEHSVLRNYQLVGTLFNPILPENFPGTPSEGKELIEHIKRPRLRNLALEPYVPTSNCMTCHSQAKIPLRECVSANTRQVEADFSLFLQNGLLHAGCANQPH